MYCIQYLKLILFRHLDDKIFKVFFCHVNGDQLPSIREVRWFTILDSCYFLMMFDKEILPEVLGSGILLILDTPVRNVNMYLVVVPWLKFRG